MFQRCNESQLGNNLDGLFHFHRRENAVTLSTTTTDHHTPDARDSLKNAQIKYIALAKRDNPSHREFHSRRIKFRVYHCR